MRKLKMQVKLKGKDVIITGIDGKKTIIPRKSARGYVLESFINNPERIFPIAAMDAAVHAERPWKKMTDQEFQMVMDQYAKIDNLSTEIVKS
jgi:site-specific recombinase XerD